MTRRRSTFVSPPKMPELAPIDVRLILVILVIAGVLTAILLTAIGVKFSESLIPPPFIPTQLETL